MSRLTKKYHDGVTNIVDTFSIKEINWCDSTMRNWESAYTGEPIDKLAEYEDIGLTPDEIKYFLKDFGISLLMENRELKKQHKAKNNWISTTGILPKEDERVIICSKNKCVSIAYYKNYFGQMRFMYFHNITESWHIFSQVIAWQPLPEPYE